MKNHIRALSFVLTLALAFSMTACSPNSSSSEPVAPASSAPSSSGESSQAAEQVREKDPSQLPDYYTPPLMNEGQYPIKQEGVKLTYWMPMNPGAANFISSYDENPAYQAVQENTGVDIEFIHPAAGTEKESLQLLMASGELPDLIQLQREDWYAGGLKALYEAGAIMDVAPYLEEHAPQYQAVVNYNETAQRQIIDDGKIYGFYKITYADPMPYVRVNLNKDWLDEFGMSEPKTIAEYETYFQNVLDNKPGVSPLYITHTSSEQWNLFMGAFDFVKGWYMEDESTAGYWATAPQLKDFLEMMNSWYEKGYLTKDFASLTQSDGQARFDKKQLAAIGDSVDLTYSRVTEFKPTNAPYMRKDAGSVIGSNLASWPVDIDNAWVTAVTSTCSNPEAAVEYLNYGYTYEGSLYFSFGVEGEAWNWGDNGLPQFTDLILNNPDGMTISNVSYAIKIHFGSRYCYPDAIGHPGVAADPKALEIRTMWDGDENEKNYLRMYPITLTTEEAAERAEIMIQVDTYADEMLLKFITGAEPLDNFDAYIAEVNARGLDRATKITQDALDRYLAK